MPPDSSPGSLDGRTGTAERAARVRFRRALALMAMTLVVPGSAQLVAGNRRIGRIVVRIWLGVVALAALTLLVVLVWHDSMFWIVSNTWLLLLVRIGLMLGAIGWVALLMDAWRIGQPLTLAMTHRRAVVGVNGVLALAVAGSMLFGAHIVGVQRDLMITMFGSGAVSGAHDGRYNVLLLGGDSGAGRVGLRPDSMTIASIDARTGKTVLIGLPRNMENFPFAEDSVMREQFPDGFDCEGCYLNGVSTWAEDNTELFGDSEHPGVDATVQAVEGITDLDINYWAMVNLEGFRGLVDAVGGVTLTVRSPIPVGGLGDDVTGYLEPGTRRLDGLDTLWYARAREGSDDYSRMARQKCVMNAMLTQVSPQAALRNFEDIAQASSSMISTNVPASEVDRFIPLALRAKSQKIATLSLVPPMIDTADPDLEVIRSKISEAIDRSEGDAPAPAPKPAPATPEPSAGGDQAPSEASEASEAGEDSASPDPEVVTGGSVGSLSDGYAANESQDLGAAC